MKLEYKKEKISVALNTRPCWFLSFIPVTPKAYDKVREENGLGKVAVWESSKMFGKGWVGVDIESGDFKIEGDFTTYTHKGEYKKLREVYQQIMKDHPEANEYYNVYLNDPRDVKEQEQLTKIIFRQR